MKKTIKLESIELDQEKCISTGLKLTHLLIIDYLHQFFSSGFAKYASRPNEPNYYYITNNKILNDLPILGIKKRRLQEIMAELEEMKIIYRFLEKNSPVTYIRLDIKELLP